MKIQSEPYQSLWPGREWKTRKLFLCIATFMFWGAEGDRDNLVLNGDFEFQFFDWRYYPQLDILVDGYTDYIPNFIVIAGGVQVLNGREYRAPAWSQGSFLVHLNSWVGSGTLKTTPLATPRWGATYNLSFDIADNPDGGPLEKEVQVLILVNEEVSGTPIPTYKVSNPEGDRPIIRWSTQSYLFIGTGETTSIVFKSITPGSFGALIDNVCVRLVDELDNGSFDRLNPPGLTRENFTDLAYVKAPSNIITNWAVTAGSIKYSGSERWQSSTDSSTYMIELNANYTQGTIVSTRVAVKIGSRYVLLYDAAANPDPIVAVKGQLMVIVTGADSGEVIVSTNIDIDGTGFTQFSVGWRTYTLEFISTKDSQVTFTFSSKVKGNDGPLLDNVQLYEVTKVGPFTKGAFSTLKKTQLSLQDVLCCLSL